MSMEVLASKVEIGPQSNERNNLFLIVRWGPYMDINPKPPPLIAS